jgi:hypothetical protein
MKGVPDDEVRAMIGGNAVEAYGLDVNVLQPVVDRIGPRVSQVITD